MSEAEARRWARLLDPQPKSIISFVFVSNPDPTQILTRIFFQPSADQRTAAQVVVDATEISPLEGFWVKSSKILWTSAAE